MSFGKRTTVPGFDASPTANVSRVRRGGYPLAVVTTGITTYVFLVLMTFIPYFNPTGRGAIEIASMAWSAALNIVAMGAIVFLAVDLSFRAMRVSSRLAYSATCGLLTLAACFGLSVMLTGWSSPAFFIVAVLPPATIGGCVLGWYRR